MTNSEFTHYETFYANQGFYIAGADEAGRGPLAGPVVAACVIMPFFDFIEGVNDSKKLTPKNRERLYDLITKHAIAWGVGIVDEKQIDEINILCAARRAFEIAVNSLSIKPYHLFTDAMNVNLEIPYTSLIKGDERVYSIAAASIVAKVTRDALMCEYDKIYPEYGFAQHKGYGTKQHREAILKYGACEIHRKTFLKKLLPE